MQFSMMILTAAILFAQIAFAHDTPTCAVDGKEITNPEEIVQAVAAQPTCWESVKLAQECSWGSGFDLQITAPAFNKCETEFNASKPKASDRKLLQTLRNRCVERYSKEQGTMYVSMNAYCQLSALEWMVNNFSN